MSYFAEQRRPKNEDVVETSIYLNDTAGISPTSVVNENAKTQQRANWFSFRLRKSEAAKILHTSWCR